MKHLRRFYIIPIILLTSFLIISNFSQAEEKSKSTNENSTFVDRSDENFNKMTAVLTHQRCVNCHPSDNTPKQGEDSHPHYFGMKRGVDNHGFEATQCQTCHQAENNDFAGVPGAPNWHLAPASMMWQGLSRVEIVESMLDKNRNGGKSHEEIINHLTEDSLVLWAWNPGVSADGVPREKPPVPVNEFIVAVKEWFEAGAIIPED